MAPGDVPRRVVAVMIAALCGCASGEATVSDHGGGIDVLPADSASPVDSLPATDVTVPDGPSPDGPVPDAAVPDLPLVLDQGLCAMDALGGPCATSLPGVCAEGTLQCSGGQLVCVASYQVGQLAEACNGKDDNCDGTVDDGYLCQDGNTCEGAAGCRCNGAAPCAGGSYCCVGGCVDLSQSTSNCGACGVTCAPGETCDGGKCRCGTTVGMVGGGPACGLGASCDAGVCNTCNPAINLAPAAAASSSGGGYLAGYEPAQLNNGELEATCNYHWIYAGSTPADKWLMLTWSQPVTFSEVWFDTAPASSGACGMSAGRTLAGGTLQILSGSQWIDLATVTGKTGDWSAGFQKVTATKLRLYGAHATSAGLAMNPMIFEWRVFCK